MQEVNDESFGIIPLYQKEGQWQVFLIQHRHAGHWGFPKGHPEKGESDRESAQRELEEEAGLKVIQWLDIEPLLETYQFHHAGKRVNKKVTYFPALVTREFWIDPDEIENGGWFPIDEALKQLTFAKAQEIIQEIKKFLNTDPTLG